MAWTEAEHIGDMFDPADWTDEQLRKYFPNRCEEFIEWKRENIEANPKYYGVSVPIDWSKID